MAYDFAEFRQAGESALGWLKKEYAGLSTGRATPSILDGVSVNAYGSPMTINQLATVAIEDPKTLRITAWDKDVTKDIDKAIRESNLGLSVAIDAAGLRVSFPELTGERRAMLSKVAKEKLEEARIKIRTEREKSLETIDRKEKDGSVSEDDKFRFKQELQKVVDTANQKLEELALKKEREILE
ncbi:MAG: ribosome recycling factor [bacterium]|nr:ribosome recycling factor [bacterium]